MDTASRQAQTSDRQLRIAFLAISTLALVGVVLRLVALDLQSLWVDELHSLRNANPNETLATLFRGYLIEEQSPPLYFILLHYWLKLVGISEWSLRLPSAVFGIASVGIAAVYARPRLERKVYYLFVAFLACSYGAIYYAQEARPYSLLLLTATAMTLATLAAAEEIRSNGRTPLRPVIALALAGLLGSFSHFFGIILCGACLATLLVAAIRHRASWWPIVGAGIAVLTIFAPWVVFQAPRMTTVFLSMKIWSTFTVGGAVHALAWFSKLLLGNYVAAGVVACLLLYCVAKGGLKSLFQGPVAVAVGIFGFGLLFAVLVSLEKPIISGRNLIILMPAAFLALAQAIGSKLSDRQFAVVAPLYVALFLFGSLYDYYRPHKHQWRESAQFISEQSGCDTGRIAIVGDPWGVQKGDLHHFRYYLPADSQVELRAATSFDTAAELRDWAAGDSCPVILWMAGKSRQEYSSLLAEFGWSEPSISKKQFVGAHIVLEPTAR